MKISKILLALVCGVSFGAANAADITVFYSPTCPHCHRARAFINETLVYEYEDLNVKETDATKSENLQAFVDALYKCGYKKGGVPVVVIGDKCFQGYSDANQPEMRSAIEVNMTDEQKATAAANKAALEQDRDAFIADYNMKKQAAAAAVAKEPVTVE